MINTKKPSNYIHFGINNCLLRWFTVCTLAPLKIASIRFQTIKNPIIVFTGIIETIGEIEAIAQEQENIHFKITSAFSSALKIDQSVAHDGVCLTVTKVEGNSHWVTAIQETLNRTALKAWQPGYKVNLERSMQMGGRLDGHLVQGHVDQTAVCTSVTEEGGSWKYYFRYAAAGHNLTVEKGSICVNGVSLTVVDSPDDGFSVAIIPYTYEHTNFHTFASGTVVNIEFDVIGKYVQRILAAQGKA